MADPEMALKLASGVRRQSLPEQVAIAILEAIVDRRLKPGDSLPSAGDLAEEFAVSRTVVREALAELMGRGVISRGSREPVISMPGPEQLQELLRVRVSQDDVDIEALVELRLPLEVQSARLAAERRTSEQLAQIAAALDTLAAETDEKRFYVADANFHREVALATGNLLIPLVLDSLSGVLHEFRTEWFAKQRAAGELPGLVAEHRKVFEAIRDGNAQAAGTAMADHLLAGLERIRSMPRRRR
ncbi:MAG TPA: FadR/GntR family transcriptional regulator [Acidimicrobiales bacterium]|nr:FadR/GntR family transcriptional regulator [Acidimicrobiales bacterium]